MFTVVFTKRLASRPPGFDWYHSGGMEKISKAANRRTVFEEHFWQRQNAFLGFVNNAVNVFGDIDLFPRCVTQQVTPLVSLVSSHDITCLCLQNAGPEVRWVDCGRPVFRFGVRMTSTIYTKDQHLHNFFSHCQKMDLNSSIAVDYGTTNQLKVHNITMVLYLKSRLCNY